MAVSFSTSKLAVASSSNIDGYWDDMVAWFETAIEAEFVTREGLSRLALIPTVDETFKYLEGEFGE